jgi:hypothetical protein
VEEVGWQLLRQQTARILFAREREEAGASKGFLKILKKYYQQKTPFHAKTHLA